MAANQARQLGQLGLLLCVILLVCFGVYLWTYEYKTTTGQAIDTVQGVTGTVPPNPRISTTLWASHATFDPAGKGSAKNPLQIHIVLRNHGNEAVPVLDAPLTTVLYDVQVTGPNGRRLVPSAANVRRAAPPVAPPGGTAPAAPRVYRIVELVPGHELHVPVPLLDLFDCSAPGLYKIAVQYRPAALRNQAGDDLADGTYYAGMQNTETLNLYLGPIKPAVKALEPAKPGTEAPPPEVPAPPGEPAPPEEPAQPDGVPPKPE